MVNQWNDYTRLFGDFVPPTIVSNDELMEILKDYAPLTEEQLDVLFPLNSQIDIYDTI